MARYNTVISSGSISAQATIGSPSQGLYTEFTGTAPYNVDLASPVTYQGASQNFYNSTSSVVTLRTVINGGYIQGPGQTGTSTTLAMPAGSTLTLFSDGSNYQAISVNGGNITTANLSATGTVGLSPTGAVVTISPTGSSGQVVIASPTANSSAGTMDNINIGATTRGSGAFTTLASNGATTFTLGTDASSYSNGGTLTVTGGVGISGQVFTNGNITSGGLLSLTVGSGKHSISSTSTGSSTTTGAFTVAGDIGCNGTIRTVGFVETSSKVFKENITPIDNALNRILKLNGVTYDRKDTKQHEAGLIAEHVFKIIPDVVSLDAKGKPYGIQYTKLTAYLIESIKTLQAEIDELKGVNSKIVKKASAKTTVKKITKGGK
jgi:hypothetical protein